VIQLLNERYRLQAVLGHAGGATTALGMDTTTGELCVVKSLALSGPKRSALRAHLERRARALARLQHPRLPRFKDAFYEEGERGPTFYVVQEYRAGRELARAVREGGRHSPRQALALARSLAELLAYLHERSPAIVHGGVKPENVLIADDGAVVLVGFAAIRAALPSEREDDKGASEPDGYQAPEQLRGRGVPASDVYSLGATLAFCLSGKEPLELGAADGSDISRHLEAPARLLRLLRWMLAHDAAARPQDGRQVLDALDAHETPPLRRSLPIVSTLAVLAAIFVPLFSWRPAPRAAQPVAEAALPAATPAPPPTTTISTNAPDATTPPARMARRRGTPRHRTSASLPEAKIADAPAAAGDFMPAAVVARDGLLRVDIYRDFKYVEAGWPGRLSVGQTEAGGLDTRPYERLRAEPEYSSPRVLYGYLSLGNGRDPRVSFVIDELERPTWVIYVDANNNEDLTDDGPALTNQGTLKLATNVRLMPEIVSWNDGAANRPYRLWLWVNELPAGPEGVPNLRARYYGTCHYAGRLSIGGEEFAAVAFQQDRHDALFAKAGLFVDLDADGEFERPSEHFRDGELIRTSRAVARLKLDYP
jgi:serine/threonine protein kinase